VVICHFENVIQKNVKLDKRIRAISSYNFDQFKEEKKKKKKISILKNVVGKLKEKIYLGIKNKNTKSDIKINKDKSKYSNRMSI
jgi:hypothetical protein